MSAEGEDRGYDQDRRYILSEVARLGRTAEQTDSKVEKLDEKVGAARRELGGRVDDTRNEMVAKVDSLKLDVNEIRLEVANLKFRQTVFGVLAMAVPSIVAAVMWWIQYTKQ